MMNKLYDFYHIQETREKQKELTIAYAFYVICFIGIIVPILIFVEDNALISVIFALLLFGFILFSVAFWRIKYGVLNRYKLFLENMEMGKRDEYIGAFKEKICATDDKDQFDIYVFEISNKRTKFLIYKQCSLEFLVDRKYHFESVGNYVYQWEIID